MCLKSSHASYAEIKLSPDPTCLGLSLSKRFGYQFLRTFTHWTCALSSLPRTISAAPQTPSKRSPILPSFASKSSSLSAITARALLPASETGPTVPIKEPLLWVTLNWKYGLFASLLVKFYSSCRIARSWCGYFSLMIFRAIFWRSFSTHLVVMWVTSGQTDCTFSK